MSRGRPLFPSLAKLSPQTVQSLLPPVFTPATSHPMLDDFTLRAARLRSKAHPNIPMGYDVPLRNHPMWSGNNELGHSIGFAPDATNRQMVVKLGEWGEPTDWTVTLGITGDYTQLTGTNRFEVVAEIEAGVGGTTQRVEVDWLNGATFTMPMNALTVTANYGDLPSGFQAPTDLRLSVTLGRSSGGRVHAPTRSFIMTVTSTTASPIIAIPAFAKNVLVYPIPGALGRDLAFFYQQSRIDFLTNNIALFVVGSFDASQTISYMETATPVYGAPLPLPIPPFARFLQLTTPGTVLPKFAIAQFELNL